MTEKQARARLERLLLARIKSLDIHERIDWVVADLDNKYADTAQRNSGKNPRRFAMQFDRKHILECTDELLISTIDHELAHVIMAPCCQLTFDDEAFLEVLAPIQRSILQEREAEAVHAVVYRLEELLGKIP